MREIKFRGLGVNSERWFYGTGVTDFLNVYPEQKGKLWLWTDDYCWVEVEPGSVGQFTGLKDKDGVGIWEGDVCSREVEVNACPSSWQQDEHWRFTGEIRLLASKGAVMCNVTKEDLLEAGSKPEKHPWSIPVYGKRTTVIGNIHDEVAR